MSAAPAQPPIPSPPPPDTTWSTTTSPTCVCGGGRGGARACPTTILQFFVLCPPPPLACRPWQHLPKLRQMAPEFYDHLPPLPGGTHVLRRFLFDPAAGENGVRSKRVARAGGEGRGRSRAAPPRGFARWQEMPLLRGCPPEAVK